MDPLQGPVWGHLWPFLYHPGPPIYPLLSSVWLRLMDPQMFEV